MMSMIEQKFAAKNEIPLFIPFITAGDPSLDATVDIIKTLEESGADIIELGVPYSDPLADGPTIQKASQRALKQNVNIDHILETVGRVREEGVKVPIILFTYYNPVLQYGMERLFQQFEVYGLDGIIIPDLPVEENREVKTFSKQYGKPLISLVAPNSEERIEQIAAQAEGFIYCVSTLGVTGERKTLNTNIEQFLNQVKYFSSVPVAVGFGISTSEQVKKLSPHCDGIIVGSALVRIIEENEQELLKPETRKNGLSRIKTFVKHLLS